MIQATNVVHTTGAQAERDGHYKSQLRPCRGLHACFQVPFPSWSKQFIFSIDIVGHEILRNSSIAFRRDDGVQKLRGMVGEFVMYGTSYGRTLVGVLVCLGHASF